MAEISRFWTTDGVGDGPAGGYSSEQFADFMKGVFKEGVLTGIAAELRPTGIISPITIAPGAAVVAGRFYESTAIVSVVVPSPVVGTTGFRINLQAMWATQQVRLNLQISDDDNPTIPILIQNVGVEWNSPIATGTITTGGSIILEDVRHWAYFSTKDVVVEDGSITTVKLANEAVTNPKLAPDAVSTSKIIDLTISEAKLQDAAVTNIKIASAAITSEKIVDEAVITSKINIEAVTNSRIGSEAITHQKIQAEAVTEPKLAPNAVSEDKVITAAITEGKLGIGAIGMLQRQGGNNASWNTPGSTNYNVGKLEIQAGSIRFDFSGQGTILEQEVVFAHAFKETPLVFLSVNWIGGAAGPIYSVLTRDLHLGDVWIRLIRFDAGFSDVADVYWLAIGEQL